MAWNDDDDLEPTAEERLTRADPRKEALKRSIEEKFGKEVQAKQIELKSESQLRSLQSQLAGQSDEEQKRKERADAEESKSSTFGTKTHLQMEEDAVKNADDNMTAEDLIAQEKARQEEQKESTQEYQSSNPG